MDTKELLSAALRQQETMRADRRALHRAPEAGISLPETEAFVQRRLREAGYAPQALHGGIVADITGRDTGRCVLLRADMDALKITEKTDLPFRAENGRMHACGHDLHTAMLLGAARLLREREKELCGTVRLVFQADEEGFTGAKALLASGVLERAPQPRQALALHVSSGTPTGTVLCGKGAFMAGCTLFRITVTGEGCHGAMPERGVDPINAAAHIVLALQTIAARELSAKTPNVVTLGRFSAGEAPNIVPGQAVLEGSIRTFDCAVTETVLRRIGEIADATARAFRASAVTEELASAPPLQNDPALIERMAGLSEELFGAESVRWLREGGMGSEDFAAFSYELPCAYLFLGAGSKREDACYGRPMHNERVIFNEDVLARGAALLAAGALRLLEEET